MEMQTRKPNFVFRKVGLLLGVMGSLLLLPLAFGFLMSYFGVDYTTAWFAANALIVGGFISTSIIPGIDAVGDAVLLEILADDGEGALIAF